VHRDLKPENILLEEKDPNSLLKIIDFGTATLVWGIESQSKPQGTPYYVAPEIL